MNNPIKILIVEDSLTQSIELKMILENNGYSVKSAENGKRALDILENYRPDIIISDVMMPEMDGYELCRYIKKSETLNEIPFILLTTLSEPEDVIKGLESGANNFLNKPYNEENLLSRIKHIILNDELRKNISTDMGIGLFFKGKKYYLNSDRLQILDLLLSTYEQAVQKAKELEKANEELKQALETIKILKGLIPICSYCKNIRNDKGYWEQFEKYISKHSQAEFSHGICPDCLAKHFPEFKRE